jgi:hypothetical protein
MNEPRLPLALSIEERRSPLWRKLTAHFESRLADMRQQNDGQRSDIETAHLRGQIAQIKSLLALNSEPRQFE